MTRRRVVHVIDGLGVGGAEMLLVTAAEQAERMGWELHVVCLRYPPPQSFIPDRLRGLGVVLHVAESRTRRNLLDVQRIARLRSLLIGLEPDVVHTHLKYSDTLAPLVLAGTGIPTVTSLHNIGSEVRPGQSVRDRLQMEVLNHPVRPTIAVGPAVAAAQSTRLGREVPYIDNPVRPAPDVRPEQADAARSELLAGAGGPLLLSAGRLNEQKGYPDLLRALASIRAELPGAVLAIAGRGALADELHILASELGISTAVRFLGARQDLPILMRATDLFVLSSHWEGLPLVLLEAMQAGCAIVATDVGDVRHALGDTGVIVAPARPDELARASLGLLNDPQRVEELGAAAREKVRSGHSPEIWADQMDRVYDSVERAPVPDSPLNLVILSHGYFPRIGGIERQRAQVTPRLVRSGARATVVTRAEAGAARREQLDGVEIVRVPMLRGAIPGSGPIQTGARKAAKPIDSLTYTAVAVAVALRLKPDVVHTHEFISTARAGLLAGRLLGVPVIATSHRSGPIGDVGRNLHTRRGKRLLRDIRRRAALAVGVSREIDAELASIGIPDDRRMVIHNGVDTDRFRPIHEPRRSALRAELGFPAGPLVIFVGRLSPEKRVALLLDVWPDVVAACPEAHLLVIGSGDEGTPLAARLPASVSLVGEVRDPAGHLGVADVFVLPSIAEGLSNALLEAQACGLPAVVTDVGAARDVVEDGKTGVIVAPDDGPALRDALIALLVDSPRRRSMSSGARAAIESRYSIDSTVADFLAAYDRVRGPAGCSES